MKEREHLGDPGIDGNIILRWIFRTLGLGCGLDRSGLGWGQLAGIYECGNEPSGFIKFGEILN